MTSVQGARHAAIPVCVPADRGSVQKRSGFTSDNLEVKAKLGSASPDHGMAVDLVFVLQ